MYTRGEGVNKSLVQADVWLALAAAAPGFENALRQRARALRMEVEAHMSAAQRERAGSMSAAWRAGQKLAHPVSAKPQP